MKICQRNHERPDNLTRCKECILFKERERYKKTKHLSMKRRYEITKDKQIAYASNWNKQNPDKKLKNQMSYARRSPDVVLAITKRYKEAKKLRTPKWLTKGDFIEMKWARDYARQLTKKLGIKHVVDHIIPLRGRNVSGLNCPQNLQVITHKLNSRKGISFSGKVG